jgi:hypothetical protein
VLLKSARESVTAPVATPNEPGRRALWPARHLIPPAVALLASWAMFAVRSGYRFGRLFDPAVWARWDSGEYLLLARHGYFAVWHCGPPRVSVHMPPGNYLCGTVQWFPGTRCSSGR